MTDNEIIKALDKCASIGESCEECPFYDYTDCDSRLKEEFHNLINRQKETIQNQDEMIRALINAQETLQKAMIEKDKEIERLKSGHILYDSEE